MNSNKSIRAANQVITWFMQHIYSINHRYMAGMTVDDVPPIGIKDKTGPSDIRRSKTATWDDIVDGYSIAATSITVTPPNVNGRQLPTRVQTFITLYDSDSDVIMIAATPISTNNTINAAMSSDNPATMDITVHDEAKLDEFIVLLKLNANNVTFPEDIPEFKDMFK